MNECSICLEDCDILNSYNSKHCIHSFHFNCINKWFEKDHRCPLCRIKLKLPKVTIQYPDTSTQHIINNNLLILKLIKFEQQNKLNEKKLFVRTKNNRCYIYNSQGLLGFFIN